MSTVIYGITAKQRRIRLNGSNGFGGDVVNMAQGFLLGKFCHAVVLEMMFLARFPVLGRDREAADREQSAKNGGSWITFTAILFHSF